MSARPETIINRKSLEDAEAPPTGTERERDSEEDIGFLPWVALVVLLACWLAEASL